MSDEERVKQLLIKLADHLADAERCVRQLIAVMHPTGWITNTIQTTTDTVSQLQEAMKNIKVSDAPKATLGSTPEATEGDYKGATISLYGSTTDTGLKAPEDAFAGVSGKTLSVDNTPEPELIKRWPDGKELWSQHITGTSLCVCADNRYMLSHPSNATEELMERLQEDHGV